MRLRTSLPRAPPRAIRNPLFAITGLMLCLIVCRMWQMQTFDSAEAEQDTIATESLQMRGDAKPDNATDVTRQENDESKTVNVTENTGPLQDSVQPSGVELSDSTTVNQQHTGSDAAQSVATKDINTSSVGTDPLKDESVLSKQDLSDTDHVKEDDLSKTIVPGDTADKEKSELGEENVSSKDSVKEERTDKDTGPVGSGYYRDTPYRSCLVIITTRYKMYTSIKEVESSLRLLRVNPEVRYSEWSFDDLDNERLYDSIVFLNLESYSGMASAAKTKITRYCKRFNIGMVIFHWFPNRMHAESELVPMRQYELRNVTKLRINPNAKLWRITKDGGVITSGLCRDPYKWAAFDLHGKSKSAYTPLTYAKQDRDSNENHVTSFYDSGERDGIRKVVIGNRLLFWIHHSLFLDALHELSHGRISLPMKRTVIIDIDDMFVGNNMKITAADVQALLELQYRMKRYVENFRFNLAFSGGGYMSNLTEDGIKGDLHLTKLKDEFRWFPHTYNHVEVKDIPTAQLLEEDMRRNKKFAEDLELPLIPHYAVSPAHVGIYPVMESLYTVWKRVWDIRVTSTMMYNTPQIYFNGLHQGFQHSGIQVMPRDSFDLYSYDLYWRDVEGGKTVFEQSITEGKMYLRFLYNALSVIMTHSYNYGYDRMANKVMENTFIFLKQWTNLQFVTEEPLVAAQEYFELYPAEKELIMQDPCNARLQPLYTNTSRCQANSKTFPDLVILGSQFTGASDLHDLLSLFPLLNGSHSALPEVGFFNNETKYRLGVEWYMDQFPNRTSPDTILFETTEDYLATTVVPSRMSALLPAVKLVFLLEDPATRANAVYQHMRARSDPVARAHSFYDVMSASADAGDDVLRLRKLCLQPGLYAMHIKHWLKYYNVKQIMIIDRQLIYKSPISVLEEIQSFLSDRLGDLKLRFRQNKDKICSENQNAPSSKCTTTPIEGASVTPMTEREQQYIDKYYNNPNLDLYNLLSQYDLTVPAWLEKASAKKRL